MDLTINVIQDSHPMKGPLATLVTWTFGGALIVATIYIVRTRRRIAIARKAAAQTTKHAAPHPVAPEASRQVNRRRDNNADSFSEKPYSQSPKVIGSHTTTTTPLHRYHYRARVKVTPKVSSPPQDTQQNNPPVNSPPSPDILADQLSRLNLKSESLLSRTLGLPRELRTSIYKLLHVQDALVPCRRLALRPQAIQRIMSLCPQFRAEIDTDWYQIVGERSTICMNMSRDDIAWTTALPPWQNAPIRRVQLTNFRSLQGVRTPESTIRTSLTLADLKALQVLEKLQYISMDLGCIEGVLARARGDEDVFQKADYTEAQDRNAGYARLMTIVLAALPRLKDICQLEISATLGRAGRTTVRPCLTSIKLRYSMRRPERLHVTEEWPVGDIMWSPFCIKERNVKRVESREIWLEAQRSSCT